MLGGWATRVPRRLLLIAFVVLFAAVLAVPEKRSNPPDREQVTLSKDPPAAVVHPTAPAPAVRERTRPAPTVEPKPSEQPIVPPSGEVVSVDDTAESSSTVAAEQPSSMDPAAAATMGGGGAVWAFVVGINDYPDNTSDLHSAVADARDMVQALNGYGVDADHVILAEDHDATGRGILRGIDWLVKQARPEDTAVFFYAGHARKLGQTTEAVVGADGAVVPDWLIAQHLEGLLAHDAWVVMASCYGGGFTELLRPGRVLTAAAGADDLAYESDSFGRSYLGEYLVRRGMLLHGAGPTAQQAFQYAQAWLQQEHPNRVLTEIDESTAPVSLDGVHRDQVPPAPSQPPPPPTTEPPAPPPSPPPKSCVLVVVCSG